MPMAVPIAPTPRPAVELPMPMPAPITPTPTPAVEPDADAPLDGLLLPTLLVDQGTNSRAASAGATEKGCRVVVLRGVPGPWRRGEGAGPRRAGVGESSEGALVAGTTARG
jgi:hypothetical protein